MMEKKRQFRHDFVKNSVTICYLIFFLSNFIREERFTSHPQLHAVAQMLVLFCFLVVHKGACKTWTSFYASILGSSINIQQILISNGIFS